MMILPEELIGFHSKKLDILQINSITNEIVKFKIPVPWYMAGAYILIIPDTEEFYIGSSHSIMHRLSSHRGYLISKQHYNHKLLEAFYRNPKLQAIVFPRANKDEALELEQILIDLNLHDNKMLNLAKDARLPGFGIPKTEEWKKLISKMNTGKPCPEWVKERVSKANKGKKMSPETLKRMSESKMGHKHSPETIEKIRGHMYGNKYGLGYRHTEEMKEKLRQVNLGRIITEETKAKIMATKERNKPFWKPDPRRKAAIVEGVHYLSIADVARKYNIPHGSAWGRIVSDAQIYKDWQYA